MNLRRIVIILLLLALPSALYARWIKDQVIMPTDAAGPVNFSHYLHLDALGNNCPTCHNGIFDIVVEKNPAYTMADMNEGKSCGACHNGNQAFSIKNDCSTCHPTRDIVFRVEDAGNVTFSHEAHTGMFGCSECHPDLFIPGAGNQPASMEQMAEGSSCGACHDGDTAFTVEDNCDTCHAMQ